VHNYCILSDPITINVSRAANGVRQWPFETLVRSWSGSREYQRRCRWSAIENDSPNVFQHMVRVHHCPACFIDIPAAGIRSGCSVNSVLPALPVREPIEFEIVDAIGGFPSAGPPWRRDKHLDPRQQFAMNRGFGGSRVIPPARRAALDCGRRPVRVRRE